MSDTLGVEVKTKEYKFASCVLVKSCFHNSFGHRSSLFEIDNEIYSLIKIRLGKFINGNFIYCDFLFDPRNGKDHRAYQNNLFFLKLKIRKECENFKK